MIIQIDHIALSSSDFEKDAETLSLLGYKNSFCEKNKKNADIKRNYLSYFSDTHDLSLFSKEGSFGIELLNHFSINKQTGFITPLFENLPGTLVERKWDDGFFEFNAAMVKGFSAPVYVIENKNSSGFKFDKFVVRTKCVDKSAAFWRCLGFKILDHVREFAVLEFNALFQEQSCRIFLKQDNSVSDHFLNDNGFNCIAMLSNSPEREALYIRNKGFVITEMAQLEINGKNLDFFFAVGPGGELAEVIGIKDIMSIANSGS
jgi:hypothetical protein